MAISHNAAHCYLHTFLQLHLVAWVSDQQPGKCKFGRARFKPAVGLTVFLGFLQKSDGFDQWASSLSSWALCSGDLTRLSWTLIQLGSAVKFLVLRSQRLALPLWAALRFLQHPAASMEVSIGGLPSPNTLRHPPTKICCYFFRDATAEPAIDWSWSFLHTASAGVWGRDTEYM